MKSVAKALHENKGLTSLYLGNNKTYAEGAQYIAEALKFNTTLQSLYFGTHAFASIDNNNIGKPGATCFSELLKANKTLTLLNLSMCCYERKVIMGWRRKEAICLWMGCGIMSHCSRCVSVESLLKL
eukprot:TRINITY_DN6608_c0_g2_i4.p2 TRINITY_DN6608_c0_g2~~TRINITY_DN6608_c0_g2_i4.p2  ORF type:complete len:127 (+),score=2.85 TRINITY_DN6608_c0_g2_i4:570-950(+)